MADEIAQAAGPAGLTTAQFFAGAPYVQANTDWSSIRDGREKGPGQNESDPLYQGAPSLFNPFTLFRYTDFTFEQYDPTMHFVGYRQRAILNKQSNLDSLLEKINQLADDERNATTKQQRDKNALVSARIQNGIQRTYSTLNTNEAYVRALSNPTAQVLIDWASKSSASTLLGFQPYSWTDFSYCKYYGKIPNNRLITLRRYPFPVNDFLKTRGGVNMIPIAQAVTWFGGDTTNSISSMFNFQWDMPWEEIAVTQQDIEGNEVLVTDLVKIFKGITGGDALAASLETLIATQNNLAGIQGTDSQLSGMDQTMQQFIKGAYNKDSGVYWNRVYGPVNVIHQSTRRKRGMQATYNTPFNIKFHYTFRSFAGISPKIAALDLISNFMQLTYNNAQFLNQLARYFPKTGLKFDSTTTSAITDLLIGWGMGTIDQNEVINKVRTIVDAQRSLYEKIGKEFSGKNVGGVVMDVGFETLNAVALQKMQDAMPKLISVKSALSDAPVGEWHLVVGNPLNPIFAAGDLLVTNCQAAFDDEIGPDDFPTGITFTVTLKQGKPRDKVALERIFNQGITSLSATRVRPPASSKDTFGPENTSAIKQMNSEQTSFERDLSATDSDFKRVRDHYGYTPSNGTEGVASTKVNDSILNLYFKKDLGQQ